MGPPWDAMPCRGVRWALSCEERGRSDTHSSFFMGTAGLLVHRFQAPILGRIAPLNSLALFRIIDAAVTRLLRGSSGRTFTRFRRSAHGEIPTRRRGTKGILFAQPVRQPLSPSATTEGLRNRGSLSSITAHCPPVDDVTIVILTRGGDYGILSSK
jgi:hypothetical protein